VISLDELRKDVESGAIDTVVVAFTDMQGGSWASAPMRTSSWRNRPTTASRAATTCSRSRWRMDPVPGYTLTSWEQGYGDFRLAPDLATLRRIPWLEGTALVLADVLAHVGSDVKPPPRQVLKAQVERAEALGYTPMFGSELEFYLLRETYEEAHAKHYRDLTLRPDRARLFDEVVTCYERERMFERG
jgi:glutamine synthetase